MTDDLPLFNALKEYASIGYIPFHMPGHMGGHVFSDEFKKFFISADITELPGMDNLHDPSGAIKQAQIVASRAYGADYTFFLVNGATSGIHAMIEGTLLPGDKLIVPRNCHSSVLGAMIHADVQPVYIKNPYSKDHDLILPVTPEQILQALRDHPDASGVLLVNPDYYGVCGRIDEIADIVHDYGKILLVDEAHGAHFMFHPDLPKSAADAGADAWVQSAHKTLPALTQTGYLHIRGNRVNKERIATFMSIIQTTSPSYLLMASLDWSRWFMESKGRMLLEELKFAVNKIKLHLNNKFNIKSIADYGLEEATAIDFTRLSIDFSSLGLTGYNALNELRKLKIEPEMADSRRVVFLLTVAHETHMIETLIEKLDHVIAGIDVSETTLVRKDFGYMSNLPEQIMSPRETMRHNTEFVPLSRSCGRICTQSVGAYPPGIPRFCPGELIDIKGINELIEIQSQGGNLFGLNQEGMVKVVRLC